MKKLLLSILCLLSLTSGTAKAVDNDLVAAGGILSIFSILGYLCEKDCEENKALRLFESGFLLSRPQEVSNFAKILAILAAAGGVTALIGLCRK